KIFYKNDNDDNHEFKVVLQRKNLLTASMNDIYTFSSNDGSNNMQVETGDLTSNSLNQRIIDNSQYSYRVLVFLDIHSDNNGPGAVSSMLYGIRIKYTY